MENREVVAVELRGIQESNTEKKTGIMKNTVAVEKAETKKKAEAVRRRRKAFVDRALCVACGCCVKVCPKNAIEIWKGTEARVREEQCVGCGKCARECPASVIEIREVED